MRDGGGNTAAALSSRRLKQANKKGTETVPLIFYTIIFWVIRDYSSR
jgi:hypothetical protein